MHGACSDPQPEPGHVLVTQAVADLRMCCVAGFRRVALHEVRRISNVGVGLEIISGAGGSSLLKRGTGTDSSAHSDHSPLIAELRLK